MLCQNGIQYFSKNVIDTIKRKEFPTIVFQPGVPQCSFANCPIFVADPSLSHWLRCISHKSATSFHCKGIERVMEINNRDQDRRVALRQIWKKNKSAASFINMRHSGGHFSKKLSSSVHNLLWRRLLLPHNSPK